MSQKPKVTSTRMEGRERRRPGCLAPAFLLSSLALIFPRLNSMLQLGRGGDTFLHGQVGEKGLHFRCAHLGRMAHVMEVDVAFDPVDVGLLGTDGAVSPVA